MVERDGAALPRAVRAGLLGLLRARRSCRPVPPAPGAVALKRRRGARSPGALPRLAAHRRAEIAPGPTTRAPPGASAVSRPPAGPAERAPCPCLGRGHHLHPLARRGDGPVAVRDWYARRRGLGARPGARAGARARPDRHRRSGPPPHAPAVSRAPHGGRLCAAAGRAAGERSPTCARGGSGAQSRLRRRGGGMTRAPRRRGAGATAPAPPTTTSGPTNRHSSPPTTGPI
jgi:hypothetical protein